MDHFKLINLDVTFITMSKRHQVVAEMTNFYSHNFTKKIFVFLFSITRRMRIGAVFFKLDLANNRLDPKPWSIQII